MPLSRRNRSGPRQGCLLAGVFPGLISSAVAQERPIVPAPRIEARIDDGLLTLDAGGAPLADVLRAIGAAGAFEVILMAISVSRSARRSRIAR